MSERSTKKKSPSSRPVLLSVLISVLPKNPLHWIGAALTFAVIGAVGAAAVIVSGVLDLSAVAPHPVGWAKLLHGTFQRSVAEHAEPVPASLDLKDPAMIMAGAGHYANVCATCHGAPGFGQNPVALSMRPEPPMLLDVANRYSDGELFRIVSGGARYSAMPAWPVSNRPDEVWAMVAFLKALKGMDRANYEKLAHGDTSIASAAATTAGAAGLNDAATPDSSTAARPGEAPRPYLPGDPQSIIASPHATDRPATGFVQIPAMLPPTAACTSCHGPDGAGRDGGAFPNLTIQSPEYIEESLKAFASGQRQSGIMWTVAANLSAADIKKFAETFGGAGAKPSRGMEAPVSTDPKLLARGEDIALHGIPRPGSAKTTAPGEPIPLSVEACQGCHGVIGSHTAAMPHLAGQNAAYIANQLRLFRTGGRGNSLGDNPMSGVTHKLDEPDIEALAAYYGSMPPEKNVDARL